MPGIIGVSAGQGAVSAIADKAVDIAHTANRGGGVGDQVHDDGAGVVSIIECVGIADAAVNSTVEAGIVTDQEGIVGIAAIQNVELAEGTGVAGICHAVRCAAVDCPCVSEIGTCEGISSIAAHEIVDAAEPAGIRCGIVLQIDADVVVCVVLAIVERLCAAAAAADHACYTDEIIQHESVVGIAAGQVAEAIECNVTINIPIVLSDDVPGISCISAGKRAIGGAATIVTNELGDEAETTGAGRSTVSEIDIDSAGVTTVVKSIDAVAAIHSASDADPRKDKGIVAGSARQITEVTEGSGWTNTGDVTAIISCDIPGIAAA